MKRVITYIVPPERDGVMLKDVLRRSLNISTTLLRKMKQEESAILKNGHPAFVTVPVKAGDVLTLTLEDEVVNTKVVPREGHIPVIFENEDILVVNKPADLTCHPTSGHYDDSMANILAYQMGENFIFRPVSRLDRGTSGIMAVAKNSYSHTFLVCEKMEREYLAITEGIPLNPCGTIDLPIGRENDSILKRRVMAEGKSAITHYRVLKVKGGRALVRLRLETGRTHQIRVHMAAIGCPLVGDFLYGREIEGFNRFALHSCFLKCTLPFTRVVKTFECPMPDDMAELID